MKVLIIEDDPMVRLINHRFLERVPQLETAIITECESAVEALNLPDLAAYELVLLDMYLPQITGTEFLSELLKRQLHPQVIMMTAANDQQTLKEAVNYGVLDYLIKPFSFERFQKAVGKYTKMLLVDNKNTISQTDLDSLFLGGDQSAPRSENRALPKGLAKLSLKKVVTVLRDFDHDFSNQEVADNSGLSRVSTKKYLDFLTEIGFLSSQVIYQGSGRPLTRFRIESTGEKALAQYL